MTISEINSKKSASNLVFILAFIFTLILLILSLDQYYKFDYTSWLSALIPSIDLILLAIIVVAIAVGLVLDRTKPHSQTAKQPIGNRNSLISQMSDKADVVISAINDGVIAINGLGEIELINPASEHLLGWKAEDALHLNYKSVIKLIDTKNQPVTEVNDPINQSQQSNEVVVSDVFSLETHSGKSFMAYISVSPIGQPGSGVILVFRDITAEKSDERQRAEFISTASHEMRTPVASIEGYLGLALNPNTASIDEKAREFITKAHESVKHLGNLFSDLLDVSKADDHRLKNEPKVVDLVVFVQGLVEGLTPKATEKGISILYKPIPSGSDEEMKVVSPVYYVNVDNDHLREVVDNLIENAIKYTLKGSIVIDIKGDAKKITISFTDSGIGIPREDLSHLFQKFYRVDNSETREIGGTGLGLYLCRRLVETMNGRIWAESEYKQGSTFFVELPRTDPEEANKLIEQASIEAERQMQTKQAEDAKKSQEFLESHDLGASPLDAPSISTTESVAPSTPIEPPAPPASLVTPPTTNPEPSIHQPVVDQSPRTQLPPVQPPQAPRTNTPLSLIEANPEGYRNLSRYGVDVPPRKV